MIIKLIVSGSEYRCDLSSGREISIPLRFNDSQPRAFGSEHARLDPLRVGTFVGDVREGGSCNCDTYVLTAHCNGTHTECIGHITAERIGVAERMREVLFPCTLISVHTASPDSTVETYTPSLQPHDRVITASAIEDALSEVSNEFLRGLAVRTLPNSSRKLAQDYSGGAFPFFSNEAMKVIRSAGVEHLLVDIPSVDRANDEGKLSNHRIFWDIDAAGVVDATRSERTITEMIFVPESIADGHYLANIQIPHFMSDAAPSRVMLFAVSEAAR